MNHEEILQQFRDSGALLNGHFKLTSGRHSDIYYEKFTLLKNPAISTKLCEAMASMLKECKPDIIVGPTTGGILIAYDVARYLGLESLYAEAGESGRIFKRGFSLSKGEKVAIVDDVLTTGRSIFEVIDLVKSYDAEVVGIGMLLDRSGGSVKFDYPYFPLTLVNAESWEVKDCPLCAKGEELTQRGSRKFKI